jgi:mono/diheme cytochrome c family protein
LSSNRRRLGGDRCAGWLAIILVVASCGPSPPDTEDNLIEQGRTFVRDQDFRRDILVASLDNPDNLYSSVRLAHYAVPGDDGWDALPVRGASATPVTTADFGSFDTSGRREGTAAPASDAWQTAWEHEALLELGRRAFETFPMRVDARLAPAVADRESAERAGFWIDRRDRVGGLVAERLDDGTEMVAWTCATCHGSVREVGKAMVAGRSNANLDAAELYRMGGHDDGVVDGWRPGQLDSSRDGVDNPTAIPDLRAVRYQSHLHAAATVTNSLMALAVRVETLLIISQAETSRPPRQLAFAIAYYLWHLQPPRADTPNPRGRALFVDECSQCHHSDGGVAGPVDYRRVGTDPTAALSPARTTGRYRVPSLAGVADRPYLLHDGSIRTLDEFLDPDRPQQGHPFGLDLSPDDRAALVDFLASVPLPN